MEIYTIYFVGIACYWPPGSDYKGAAPRCSGGLSVLQAIPAPPTCKTRLTESTSTHGVTTISIAICGTSWHTRAGPQIPWISWGVNQMWVESELLDYNVLGWHNDLYTFSCSIFWEGRSESWWQETKSFDYRLLIWQRIVWSNPCQHLQSYQIFNSRETRRHKC